MSMQHLIEEARAAGRADAEYLRDYGRSPRIDREAWQQMWIELVTRGATPEMRPTLRRTYLLALGD